jgi:hypothetical protein
VCLGGGGCLTGGGGNRFVSGTKSEGVGTNWCGLGSRMLEHLLQYGQLPGGFMSDTVISMGVGCALGLLCLLECGVLAAGMCTSMWHHH